MRWSWVAAVVLVAGCGSAAAPEGCCDQAQPPRPCCHTAAQPSEPVPLRVPAQSPELTATEAENQQLLASVTLPPGSVKVDAAQVPAVAQPAQRPATSDLVDQTQFWTVPLKTGQMLTWAKTHVPEGLDDSGGGSSGGSPNGPAFSEWFVGSSVSPDFTDPSLLYSYAAFDGGTALRIDAQTVVVHPQSGAEHVPTTVTTATLTAYQGMPSTVQVTRTVNSTAAKRLMALLDAAHTEGNSVKSCAYDNGFRIEVDFPETGQTFRLNPACGDLAVSANGTQEPSLVADAQLSAALYGQLGLTQR